VPTNAKLRATATRIGSYRTVFDVYANICPDPGSGHSTKNTFQLSQASASSSNSKNNNNNNNNSNGNNISTRANANAHARQLWLE